VACTHFHWLKFIKTQIRCLVTGCLVHGYNSVEIIVLTENNNNKNTVVDIQKMERPLEITLIFLNIWHIMSRCQDISCVNLHVWFRQETAGDCKVTLSCQARSTKLFWFDSNIHQVFQNRNKPSYVTFVKVLYELKSEWESKTAMETWLGMQTASVPQSSIVLLKVLHPIRVPLCDMSMVSVTESCPAATRI